MITCNLHQHWKPFSFKIRMNIVDHFKISNSEDIPSSTVLLHNFEVGLLTLLEHFHFMLLYSFPSQQCCTFDSTKLSAIITNYVLVQVITYETYDQLIKYDCYSLNYS